MGQAEDSILQVFQLRELKETKCVGRVPKQILASLRDYSCQKKKNRKTLLRMACRQNRERSSSSSRSSSTVL